MKTVSFLQHRAPLATEADRAYRKTTNRLGVTLVLFLLLFSYLGIVFVPIEAMAAIHLRPDAAAAVSDVCDSLSYLLSFMLPAILFHLITPKQERIPMMLSPRMPRGTVWLVLIGMLITTCAAIINSAAVSWFGYGSSYSDVIGAPSIIKDYQGVLLFIGTAIVPAFSEEFLFRGVVCNNLRPYGKTVAVIGSAVLFGLMHHNVGQLFYTTIAGVVLAVVYLETRSIWPSVLIHLFNNLSSVVYDIVGDRLEIVSGNRVLALMDATTMALGLVALLVMVVLAERFGHGKASMALLRGRWDEEISTAGAVTPARRVRDFLSPGMLAFCIWSIVETLMLLVIVLAYSYR